MARGTFQAIHTVLVDGPDYQALTPPAKLTWLTLKIALGASGIDVVPGLEASLVERTGLAPKVLDAALAELHPAWLLIQRNVVWVVDGLRYNPSVRPTHAVHRRSVQQHIAGLPRLAIVGAFVTRYTPDGWFPADEWVSPAYPEPDASLELGTGEAKPSLALGFLNTSYFVVGSKSSKRDLSKARKEPPEEPAGFAELWAAYPKRAGGNPRKEALAKYRACLAKQAEPADLLAGVERYAAYVRAVGNEGTQFVMQCATFLGPSEHWKEPYEIPPPRPPKPGTQEWKDAELERRANETAEQMERAVAWSEPSAVQA